MNFQFRNKITGEIITLSASDNQELNDLLCDFESFKRFDMFEASRDLDLNEIKNILYCIIGKSYSDWICLEHIEDLIRYIKYVYNYFSQNRVCLTDSDISLYFTNKSFIVPDIDLNEFKNELDKSFSEQLELIIDNTEDGMFNISLLTDDILKDKAINYIKKVIDLYQTNAQPKDNNLFIKNYEDVAFKNITVFGNYLIKDLLLYAKHINGLFETESVIIINLIRNTKC